MKKTIAVLTLLAVTAFGVQTASAGDREWATAGKVLTGLVAAHVVARAFEPAPVYTTAYYPQPQPVYVQPARPVIYQQPVCQPQVIYQQPVYYQPAPVYYYAQPVPIYVPAPRVCYAPPIVSFNFGFGHGYHSHHGYRR